MNPTQFGANEDFGSYPRTLESDLSLLRIRPRKQRVAAVFAPSVNELYPGGLVHEGGSYVETHGASRRLEGAARPHFFRGVCTVVTKLLNAVQPSHMYVGQKDAQQCLVLIKLVRDLLLPVTVVVCPTLREANGLAMSSRNEYLAPADRAAAGVIRAAFLAAEQAYASGTVRTGAQLLECMRVVLAGEARGRIDYLSCADGETLEEVAGELDGRRPTLLSGAVYFGTTRLIDNLVLQPRVR